jgi:hypothetical protein
VKGIWWVVDTETKKDVGKGRRRAALMCKRMNERTIERERVAVENVSGMKPSWGYMNHSPITLSSNLDNIPSTLGNLWLATK